MSRLVFHPPAVQPSGAQVRIDTASGSDTPATGLLSMDGSPIPATLAADGVTGAVPAFQGPADGTTTLYLKTLDEAHAAVVATVAVTGTSAGTPAAPTGTSSAPSLTPIARLNPNLNDNPVVVTAGSQQVLHFTGGSIVTGGDYWGTPGSALDLGVTIDTDGNLRFPEGEATYDIHAQVDLFCNAADAGKLVGVHYSGWDGDGTTWEPVHPSGLYAVSIPVDAPDRVFVGDTEASVQLWLYSDFLTVAPTFINYYLAVTKRTP